MEYRIATRDDAAQVGAVLHANYNIASVAEGGQAFLGELTRGYRFVVAVEAGRVCGIVSWAPHGLPKHGLAELDRIAVLPNCQGNGIGRALFQKLLEDAQAHYAANGGKLRKLFLMTHANNLSAHAFYRKMGMAHEATLPSHYYASRDEFVFSLFLDGDSR
ncbi:MAG: GNAT family N-acetyltransferase [Planctomycetes bacterium]|nr:GNAT family N-acetyltransferase [Planctomycetota bacterium]MBM4081606.1 GNAT family N-acetyltransferase [Planctomycetota bacterium]